MADAWVGCKQDHLIAKVVVRGLEDLGEQLGDIRGHERVARPAVIVRGQVAGQRRVDQVEAGVEVGSVADVDDNWSLILSQQLTQAVDDTLDDDGRDLTLLESNRDGTFTFASTVKAHP